MNKMDIVKKLNPFKRHQTLHDASVPPQRRLNRDSNLNPDSHRGPELRRKAAAERELMNLNCKIEKLLTDIDNSAPNETNFSDDEGCVICMSAKATMKTIPCGHTVVCRKCFVKTIQSAVADRCFPLKCVVCRTKILKLKQSKKSTVLHAPSTSLPPRSRLAQRLLSCGGSAGTVNGRRRSTSPASPIAPRPSNVTRLMHPLLIYPSGPGSEKRPGTGTSRGWVCPNDEKPIIKPSGTRDSRVTRVSHLSGDSLSTKRPRGTQTPCLAEGTGWAEPEKYVLYTPNHRQHSELRERRIKASVNDSFKR